MRVQVSCKVKLCRLEKVPDSSNAGNALIPNKEILQEEN
jgi:hypothetical protein